MAANRDRLLQLVLENVHGLELAPPDGVELDCWALVTKYRTGSGQLMAAYTPLSEADAARLAKVMTSEQLRLVAATERGAALRARAEVLLADVVPPPEHPAPDEPLA